MLPNQLIYLHTPLLSDKLCALCPVFKASLLISLRSDKLCALCPVFKAHLLTPLLW